MSRPRPDPAATADTYERLNADTLWVHLFDIGPDGVRQMPKPGLGRYAEPLAKQSRDRAELYADFLSEVVASHGLAFRTRLAIDVHDMPEDYEAAPVFAFQRPRGTPNILLPDVDLLVGSPNLARFRDRHAYRRKTNTAVFVGSTTGAWITTDVLRARALPRLRAALFFQGNPDVDFRLPNIVQCDTPEIEREIRALGFGGGAIGWPEQLQHRFLLSMDGNGAACSRVATALASNSVMVKYASEHELFYFCVMEPMRHYLPVTTDPEVLDIIAEERRAPGTFREVATASTEFSDMLLTNRPLRLYGARLLSAYCEQILGLPAA